ncbi:hypothetical protein RCL1_003138 [Eukaryota sp. TZLM3-RCL]
MSSLVADESALSNKWSHLLQPFRDLAENWNINIDRDLESYMQELEDIAAHDTNDLDINFAHAAVIIHGSSAIYSRKVEYLHGLLFDVMEQIDGPNETKSISKPRRQNNTSFNIDLCLEHEISTAKPSQINISPFEEAELLLLTFQSHTEPRIPLLPSAVEAEEGPCALLLDSFLSSMEVCQETGELLFTNWDDSLLLPTTDSQMFLTDQSKFDGGDSYFETIDTTLDDSMLVAVAHGEFSGNNLGNNCSPSRSQDSNVSEPMQSYDSDGESFPDLIPDHVPFDIPVAGESVPTPTSSQQLENSVKRSKKQGKKVSFAQPQKKRSDFWALTLDPNVELTTGLARKCPYAPLKEKKYQYPPVPPTGYDENDWLSPFYTENEVSIVTQKDYINLSELKPLISEFQKRFKEVRQSKVFPFLTDGDVSDDEAGDDSDNDDVSTQSKPPINNQSINFNNSMVFNNSLDVSLNKSLDVSIYNSNNLYENSMSSVNFIDQVSERFDSLTTTALTKKVATWHQQIIPILEQQETKPPFLVQDYVDVLMSKVTKSQDTMTVESVLNDDSQSEIARKFVTLLHLVNSGHVIVGKNESNVVTEVLKLN